MHGQQDRKIWEANYKSSILHGIAILVVAGAFGYCLHESRWMVFFSGMMTTPGAVLLFLACIIKKKCLGST